MDIRLKSKNSWVGRLAFIVAIFSIVTSSIISMDVVIHREFIEKDGFYKTKEFMDIIGPFNNYLISRIKDYKDVDNLENISSNEISAKQDELRHERSEELTNLNNEYGDKLNEASSNGDASTERQLKEELFKKLENVQNSYGAKIDDIEGIKKSIIDERLEKSKPLEKKLSSFKNIKYVAIDGKDGTIKSNISFDKNNIQKSFQDKTGFYLKIYSKDGESNPYNTIYDCNTSMGTFGTGKEDFSKIVENVSNSNVTLYMSVPEKLLEGDPIYFANRDYNNKKTKIMNEAILAVVSFLMFLAAVFISVANKKNNKDNSGNIIKKIPLELRIIVVLAAFIGDAVVLVGYYSYYPYRDTQALSLIDFGAIVATSLALIIGIRFTVSIFNGGIKEQVESKSILYTIYIKLKKMVVQGKELIYMKSIFLKATLLAGMCLLLMLPLAVFIGAVFSHDGFMYGIVGLFIILIFAAVVTAYVMKKIIVLDKIIVGAEKITSGDLNYTIDVRGKGNLPKLADDINNMKSGLKTSIEKEVRSERLKTELITNVSHDLKTPLTSIISYIDLLKNNNRSPEDVRNYIEVLDRKSQRLKVLIEDLFEASKAASGSIELNIEKVEVTSLLRQTLAEFEEKIDQARLDFKIIYPEDKLYIMADGKKLWRVFENLISNILKYSLQGTRVYIAINNESGRVKISMKNISAFELDIDPQEILERFKRGDQSRHTEGSGLGLAIAKSLVEIQDGSFSIEIDGDLFKANVEFAEVR